MAKPKEVGRWLADVERRRAAGQDVSDEEQAAALAEYNLERLAGWRDPELVRKALVDNPWALAMVALAADYDPSRGDDVFDAVVSALASSVRLTLQRDRRAMARTAPELREALRARSRHEADATRRTQEWRRWEAAWSAWVSTTGDRQQLWIGRVVPAFNALGTGASICTVCGRFFATPPRKRSQTGRTRESRRARANRLAPHTCGERCAGALRQKKHRITSTRERFRLAGEVFDEDSLLDSIDLQREAARVTVQEKNPRRTR